MYLSKVSRWTKSRHTNFYYYSNYYHRVALRRKPISPSSSSASSSSSSFSSSLSPSTTSLRHSKSSNTQLCWMSLVTTKPTDEGGTGVSHVESNTPLQQQQQGTPQHYYQQQQQQQVQQQQQLPPLPHADDDAMTLLESSHKWFHVVQHGILKRRHVTTELDHLGQVVSAYATKAKSSLSSSSSSQEPFSLWLQAACHAEDTTRAFHALEQWHEFHKQQLQPSSQLQQEHLESSSDQSTSSSSSSSSSLSGVNLLRQFASLSSSTSSPLTSSTSSSTSTTTTPSSTTPYYKYTPLDAANMTWNLCLAIQQQQQQQHGHVLALDPRWNMTTEAYYHVISSLCQAILRPHHHNSKQQPQQPSSLPNSYNINYYHRWTESSPNQQQQQQQPPPLQQSAAAAASPLSSFTAPFQMILWDRLTRIMSEFLEHSSSSHANHITTPQQMALFVQSMDQALSVAALRQDHDLIWEWSEQLQRRLFISPPVQAAAPPPQEEEAVILKVAGVQGDEGTVVAVQGAVDISTNSTATTPTSLQQTQNEVQGGYWQQQDTLEPFVPGETNLLMQSTDNVTPLNHDDNNVNTTTTTLSTSGHPKPPPQAHPMLLQALQLEHYEQLQQQQQQKLRHQQQQLQQQQQQQEQTRNYRGGKVQHKSNPSSLTSWSQSNKVSASSLKHDSLVTILGRVSSTMQRAILSDASMLPLVARSQLATLIVQQLEAIHDQVALLPPRVAEAVPTSTDNLDSSGMLHGMTTALFRLTPTTPDDGAPTTTTRPLVSDAAATVHEETTFAAVPTPTSAMNELLLERRIAAPAKETAPTAPAKTTPTVNLLLPTLENYLLAWNSWVPLVFRNGMKGTVVRGPLVYLDDLSQSITARNIIDEHDLDTHLQIFTPLIRAHCSLMNTKKAEHLLEHLSSMMKDIDVVYEPEIAKHRQIIKDLWNRLLNAEFSQGNYQDVVRLVGRMGHFNVFLTEIARTLQLESLMKLAPHDDSAASKAIRHLEVMLSVFHDFEDRGVGSYAPPPTAQHYLAVLTAMLHTREHRIGRLVKAGNTALQLLDTAEAEAAQHVHKRLVNPDKRSKHSLDQLLTIPAHYETVIAIWERCRRSHPAAEKIIDTLNQRLVKRKAGALKTSNKLRGLRDDSSMKQYSSSDPDNNHKSQVGHSLPNVDVLLQRTRQWSEGQNILQLVTLLEDWLTVVMADEPSQLRTASDSDNNQGTSSNVALQASLRKRATSHLQAVECMQLLLSEWVEVLGQATRSNLWDSSYPSDRTTKPFRLLLQAYRHVGDGPAAFEVLNEWQRALASQWSLSPDLVSLHLVLEAYVRQQQNSPSSSSTDAVADEVAKIWELLQRWHTSGRVNLQIETISHVVKCLTLPHAEPEMTNQNVSLGNSTAAPSYTGPQDPAYHALRDRLTTCFEVMTNLLHSESLRPIDLYFFVRAYCDALRCAESVGDLETMLKWGHAFHNTIIYQPKELIDFTFQLEKVPGTPFQKLLTSAYGVVQRGIFLSPKIEPQEKTEFLENIVEELETMGKSVGGVISSQDYERIIRAFEVSVRSKNPQPSQKELIECGEHAEQLLHRMKLLNTANNLHPFSALDGVSRIWCLAGSPERGEAILKDTFTRQSSINELPEKLESWNNVFQSYCALGRTTEALRLYRFMANEGLTLTTNSWYSLFQVLASANHSLSFEELSALWTQLEKQFYLFETTGKGVPPTAAVLADGMTAFAKGSYPFAGEVVEEILARMASNRIASKRPSEEHYAAAALAWLNSNNPSREQRVRFLTSKMSTLDQEPSLPAYTRAMKILSLGRTPIAARHAESMLEDLEKCSLLNPGLAPNRDCYAAVIDAWLNCDIPDAASYAQAILDRLESEYERTNYDIALQPSASLYERVIHKWSLSSAKEGGLRAEQCLSRWEKLVEEQGLVRHFSPYLKVIQANKFGKTLDAGERAESVLTRLLEHFEESNPQAVATAATDVLMAWAHGSQPDMGVRSWNFFKRISKISKVPDVNFSVGACLESVIRACAFAPCDDKETRDETSKVALRAFAEMQDRNIDVPRRVFKDLLQTFGRHVHEAADRTKAVSTIFQRCCAEGKVDMSVLKNVRLHSAFVYADLCTGPNKSLVILPDWCRNVPSTDEIHNLVQQVPEHSDEAEAVNNSKQ